MQTEGWPLQIYPGSVLKQVRQPYCLPLSQTYVPLIILSPQTDVTMQTEEDPVQA